VKAAKLAASAAKAVDDALKADEDKVASVARCLGEEAVRANKGTFE
jgi:hypothetical protein